MKEQILQLEEQKERLFERYYKYQDKTAYEEWKIVCDKLRHAISDDWRRRNGNYQRTTHR